MFRLLSFALSLAAFAFAALLHFRLTPAAREKARAADSPGTAGLQPGPSSAQPTDVNALSAELARLNAHHAAQKQKLAALETELTARREREAKIKTARETLAQQLATLHATPGHIAFQQREQRRLAQQRYGPLFAQLNLAPATLDRVKDILAEMEQSNRDAAQLLSGPATRSSTKPEVVATQAAANTELEAELKTLLTPDQFSQLSAHQGFLAQETRTHIATGAIAALGATPLNAEQIVALQQTYADAERLAKDRATASGQKPASANTFVADYLAKHLPGTLDAAQLTALARYHQEIDERARLMKSAGPTAVK